MTKIAEGTPITAKVKKVVKTGFYASPGGIDSIIVPREGMLPVDKGSIQTTDGHEDMASYQQDGVVNE